MADIGLSAWFVARNTKQPADCNPPPVSQARSVHPRLQLIINFQYNFSTIELYGST